MDVHPQIIFLNYRVAFGKKRFVLFSDKITTYTSNIHVSRALKTPKYVSASGELIGLSLPELNLRGLLRGEGKRKWK